MARKSTPESLARREAVITTRLANIRRDLALLAESGIVPNEGSSTTQEVSDAGNSGGLTELSQSGVVGEGD